MYVPKGNEMYVPKGNKMYVPKGNEMYVPKGDRRRNTGGSIKEAITTLFLLVPRISSPIFEYKILCLC